ncbi:SDR family oxidoreductase [Arhodomonas sp. AD133]|uniref:SDR family oxidoreductase n=1 Tax=Arhodomonas sp. AD133 TaxID=3415009 RepID=UPI003EBE942E
MYQEKFSLAGRNAVVTGGGRGIGFAICEALAEAGAHVVVVDVNDDGAQAAVDRLGQAGYSAEAFALDVTDPEAVGEAASALATRLGHVDVLVNNAGVAANIDATDYDDDAWRHLMGVNLDGVFYCCRAFGRHMVAQGSGAVVNLGSMSGLIVNKPQPQAPYNASKAAVHQLTRSLACEWAEHGVRVNAVAPGYVNTELTLMGRSRQDWNDTWLEMTPMNRCAEVDEIASAVLFLASDAASFCTGSVLVADGGYSCW